MTWRNGCRGVRKRAGCGQVLADTRKGGGRWRAAAEVWGEGDNDEVWEEGDNNEAIGIFD